MIRNAPASCIGHLLPCRPTVPTGYSARPAGRQIAESVQRFPSARRPPEVLVAERDDLALDARAQRAQKQAELDAHLETRFRHGHRPGRSGPLEAEIVAVPGERPAVVVTQPPRDALRQTLGFGQPEIVLSANDDRRHAVGATLTLSRARDHGGGAGPSGRVSLDRLLVADLRVVGIQPSRPPR